MHHDRDGLVQFLSRHPAQADQRTPLILPDRVEAPAVHVSRDLDLQRDQAPSIGPRRLHRLRRREGRLLVEISREVGAHDRPLDRSAPGVDQADRPACRIDGAPVLLQQALQHLGMAGDLEEVREERGGLADLGVLVREDGSQRGPQPRLLVRGDVRIHGALADDFDGPLALGRVAVLQRGDPFLDRLPLDHAGVIVGLRSRRLSRGPGEIGAADRPSGRDDPQEDDQGESPAGPIHRVFPRMDDAVAPAELLIPGAGAKVSPIRVVPRGLMSRMPTPFPAGCAKRVSVSRRVAIKPRLGLGIVG